MDSSILNAIGKTPLVRLRRVLDGLDAEVWAKVEYLNPSGSIKDRIALSMITAAESEGKLRPGGTIVEASTGNTAIALAFVAAVKGYRVMIFMPAEVASGERVKLMRAFGAEIQTVDARAEGMAMDPTLHGGILEILPRMKCRDLEASTPGVWWARQFSNPENVRAHRETTGREIVAQAVGRMDGFAASVGTGGTLLGVAQALREAWPDIRVMSVEPTGLPMLGKEARHRMPIVPGITDGILVEIDRSGLVHDTTAISDDEAVAMTHRLATEEGLACGVSAGANVVAAIRLARQLGPRSRVVTVLPDRRDRYLTVEKYIT
ncbi:MAG: cysteine synthase family protein [Armatimonadota bacterium]|nr:cysteine synthase family protein [Armatimonadota bacterium]